MLLKVISEAPDIADSDRSETHVVPSERHPQGLRLTRAFLNIKHENERDGFWRRRNSWPAASGPRPSERFMIDQKPQSMLAQAEPAISVRLQSLQLFARQ